MRFFSFLRPCFSAAPTARRVAAALLLSAGLVGQARAQETDTTFVRLLRKNTFALTANGTELAGPGWARLQQDIQKSQLVLIGEDHGMAQIPGFATAVARELKPALYVAEIDQYQAQDLSRLAAQPGLPTAYNQQHAMSLSFYSWAEEFELARALRAQNATIIGIDQVSMMSTGSLFGRMAAQAKSKPVRAELQRRAAAYQAQDRAALVRGTNTFSIYQRPSALDSLRALTRQEGPQVQQMVRDFALSSEIYALNQTQGAKSHQTRINLMKRSLLASLRPYDQPGQPLPKMLFKFGAAHVGRGASLIGGVYDVGNLAVNLTDVHDQKSLHIFIIGKQGLKAGMPNPDDLSKPGIRYANDAEQMVQPFAAATSTAGAWQVFDLRPLRRYLLAGRLKVSNQTLATVLQDYDYMVIIPETTASRPY
ncbi:hypothetical protein E5K00_05120 [Hymenobacter aquaticus]|uniref:Haem-binding uptake Tiki superfamily ChaN domain-containing protein n=1 Tax=Hymenobacter aquaticus TaxID=1867101 RepID=A0A4Z0Q3H2_9BACT|nr:hypothetical protein [Hymenobacter aquaticus]TGE24597.1 hypothetical protein E5K00_05120 [Hymenobacter aquaticus]